MQQVDFPYEILIFDDCSTDGTTDIVLDYARQYPHKVKAFIQKQNQFSLGPKFRGEYCIWVFQQPKSKYVALCEGDDYWTDPYKLQKQVDFLEAHPEYSICFHPVKILKNDTGELIDDFITRDVPETTDIHELAKGNFMHTCSVVYRNLPRDTGFEEVMKKSAVGDYVLHMFNAKNGLIKKLPNTMAVYRFGSPYWSQRPTVERARLMRKTCALLSPYFDANVRQELERQIECYSACIRSLEENKWHRLSNFQLLKSFLLAQRKDKRKLMVQVLLARIKRRLSFCSS